MKRLLIALLALQLQAGTIYWSGVTSGAWITATNWNGAATPPSGSDIIISTNTAVDPYYVGFPATVTNLTAASSFNSLTLGGTASVTVYKPLTITQATTSGTSTIGNLIAVGKQNAINIGTLTFTGGSLVGGTISLNVVGMGTGSSTVTVLGAWSNTSGYLVEAAGTFSIGNGSTATTFNNATLSGTIIANAATLSAMTNTGTLRAAAASTWTGGTNSGLLTSAAGTLSVTGTLANTGTLSGALISAATISGGTISGGTISGALTIGGVALLGTNVGNGTTSVTGASSTNNGLKFTVGSSLAINAGGSLTISGTR